MTVKELIFELQKFKEDLEVNIYDSENNHNRRVFDLSGIKDWDYQNHAEKNVLLIHW